MRNGNESNQNKEQKKEFRTKQDQNGPTGKVIAYNV